MTNHGTVRVNMAQMSRWPVYQDNVRFFDAIMRNNGVVSCLDVRPYVELLTEYNIFFTSPLLDKS